ncbi:CapA family protein [Paenibacillus sp. NPDC057934]|uniref:CapA family protein n=1 Tax=Paenibacillus sp. NPDC057934 TaxID=3346282 RepID=UPI0036D9435C
MYSPRSSSRRKDKPNRRRRRTIWAWINVSLLLMITALLTYGFTSENGYRSSYPPPVAQATDLPSPDPAVQESDPPASANNEDEVAVTPEVTATPEVTPEPEVTVTPEVTATVAPTATPTPSSTSEDDGSGGNTKGTAGGRASAGDSSSPTDAGGKNGTGSKPPSDSKTGDLQGKDSNFIAGLPAGLAGERTVKLSFAGDVIFSGKAGELLKQKGYDYSYSALDGMFKKDDLTVVNLETPITTRGVGAQNKQFVFKGAPEALDALKAAGIDAVNLANNHTLDQGQEGLRDTMAHLDKRGIPHVGAGLNSKEAYSAQYFERNGIKIALLGFTRVMPVMNWKAGPNTPGIASVYDSAEGLQAIAAAKKKADLVVVVVHWGKERVDQYDSVQQKLGHSFIDAGADLVIGGHPHVLQGIEPYKGKWIAYSTGNFIFTKGSIPTTWETAVFQAECNIKGQCSMKLKPMDAELARPVPMNDVAGGILLKRIESLSSGLVRIGADGKVTQKAK